MAVRRGADGLRAEFVANRERVRSWPGRWGCGEVEWPPFHEIPRPWVVPPRKRKRWLERHAPFLEEYEWRLEATPVAEGVNALQAVWAFGGGHGFKELTIRLGSYFDPDYLAETLALGIGAAGLRGWKDDDVHGVYTWLRDGARHCLSPGSGAVRGQHRTGFLLCSMSCLAISSTDVVTEVRVTLTGTALDGAPLTADGRS
ncbi:hypothetical protein HFP72_34750 [Nocardiopsis sp. ARC36]